MTAIGAGAGLTERRRGAEPASRARLASDTPARLADALRPLLAGLDRGAPRLVAAAAIPVAAVDPIAVLEGVRPGADGTMLWHQPAAGRSLVGIGSAWGIELDGPCRFDDAADAWRSILQRAVVGGPAAGRSGAGPVLSGGATFADGASPDPLWRGFERGRLEVPRLLVGQVDGAAVLTAALTVGPDTDVEGEIRRLQHVAAGLSGQPTPSGDGFDARAEGSRLRIVRRQPDLPAWRAAVGRSAGAVGRGRIDKVVLARRVDLEASAPIDVPGTLRRLEQSAPTSTIFAIARAGRVFLGATPERLVETRGRTFRTVALAGTAARGRDDAEDERLAAALLASEKDREEHAVVVEMLRDTLAPLAERIEIDRAPHVVRLRTVQHLASEVGGSLRGTEGLLGLVGRLHPTPAVGGWPRAEALELLAEEERIDRGWYAGPVGWLDAAGDGEFVVAIRSGVVDGPRASLFAGCGIVADSEPDREWAESEMKLHALASALGPIA